MKQNSKVVAEVEEDDKNSGNGTYTCKSLQHVIAETVAGQQAQTKPVADTSTSALFLLLGLRPLSSISGFRDLTSDL